MTVKLIVHAGPEEGKVYTIMDDTTVTLGRGDTAQIRLTDPAISRAHCTIDYYGGEAIIKDSASRTGTRVNGQLITEHYLAADEIISVGASKLRFQRASQMGNLSEK